MITTASGVRSSASLSALSKANLQTKVIATVVPHEAYAPFWRGVAWDVRGEASFPDSCML